MSKARKGKLAEFRPQRVNANRHTVRGLKMLDDSMAEDGYVAPMSAAANGEMLDGSARLERVAERFAGIDPIVVEHDGRRPIIMVRTDIPSADTPAARRIALRANRIAQADLDWDADVLAQLVQDDPATLRALFADDELAAVLAGAEPEQPGGEPDAQLNRAEELREQYGVERGQVWACGRHRFMCGDSYSEDDRAALLAGAAPGLLHTDPPYGISIVQPRRGQGAADSGGAKPFGGTSGTARKSGAAFRGASGDRAGRVHVQHGAPSRNQIIQSNLYPVIQGDDRPFDPAPLLGLAPIVILWGANYYADKLPPSACWIAWDKREDITRNTFADCELAWCNLSKPARLFHHLWNGLHKGSQHGERRTHPTEKPVALFEEVGKMFCPAGNWLDLYAGTGAQMLAAERAGATCYSCEIEPLYVACALDRWHQMTGRTPERVP